MLCAHLASEVAARLDPVELDRVALVSRGWETARREPQAAYLERWMARHSVDHALEGAIEITDRVRAAAPFDDDYLVAHRLGLGVAWGWHEVVLGAEWPRQETDTNGRWPIPRFHEFCSHFEPPVRLEAHGIDLGDRCPPGLGTYERCYVVDAPPRFRFRNYVFDLPGHYRRVATCGPVVWVEGGVWADVRDPAGRARTWRLCSRLSHDTTPIRSPATEESVRAI